MKILSDARKSRKAILYSLDAALGLLYTLIIMTTIIGYFDRSIYNKQASMQMYDIGSDALAILHTTGALQNYYSENEWFFNNSAYDRVTGFTAPITGIGCSITPRVNGKYFDNVFLLNSSVCYADIQTASTRDLIGAGSGASISVWIKHNNNNRNMTIFDDAWINLTSRIKLSLDPTNHVVLSVTDKSWTTNKTFTTSTTVSYGVWHHIVAEVYLPRDQLNISIDKVISSSTASPFGAVVFTGGSIWTTRIGGNVNGNFSFIGQIDNLQVFNRAVDYSEITSLYANDTVSNGLVAKYTFNGESTVLNSTLQLVVPVQYITTAELKDKNNRTISNIDIPDPAIDKNFRTSAERIVAVRNASTDIGNIVQAKLYLMVR